MPITRRWSSYRAICPGLSTKRYRRYVSRERDQGNDMRIDGRNLGIYLILGAAMCVEASAQGRGGPAAATNGFYRFNYNLEEMQPISYPAQPIATQHQITLHNEVIKYTARVGFMPIRHATTGVS